jgi:flagellar hook-basal body complex protein FliE
MSGFNIEMMSRATGAAGGIDRLSESRSTDTKIQAGDDAAAPGSTFGDLLKGALNDANQDQITANNATQELIAGRSRDLHGTILSVEKADISFRLLTQVRNKVIDAYREIMKMQV